MKSPYTHISCVIARNLAEDTLVWISRQKKLQVDRWLCQYMKEDQRGFWDRLFKRPAKYPTLQEAEIALHEKRVWCPDYCQATMPSPYEDIQMMYSRKERIARQIIELTKVSITNEIVITAETLSVITP